MRTLDFLTHRAAFIGLPFGELDQALRQVRERDSWEIAFRRAAHSLRQLAEERQRAGCGVSAAQAWQWTACAYQAACLGMHLEPERPGWPVRILRLRRLARSCYARALGLDPELGRLVSIPVPGGTLHGYLRKPRFRPRVTVVLVNGLDSICEAELHRFGEAFLQRGFAVLALALPDNLAPVRLGLRAEIAAPAISDWLETEADLEGTPLAGFGVSFGGHLAARLLAGDPRFRAAVAVSPAAWLDHQQLALRRVRRMFSLAFGVEEGPGLDRLAGDIHLADLPAPEGRLLVLQMEFDELFGPQHLTAFALWARARVETRFYPAEHVGTSQIHQWLPEACDWIESMLPHNEGEK